MDAFRVEVSVQSYSDIVDGRKVCRKGRTWSFLVGHDFSINDLRQAVEGYYNLGDNQRMTAWYRSEDDDYIPLICESEIMQLFDS